MDDKHFDVVTRLLTVRPSRRDVLRGLAGAGVGLATLRGPNLGHAKKKPRRKKKPKLQRNEFGCVDVGGTCRGNDANCCSGLCEGKKPKKGKKDKSVCVAHDTAGICFPDTDTCTLGKDFRCNLENESCFCVLTTGNAGFCGDFGFTGQPDVCRDCFTDTDCQDEFGPGAACVVLGGICSVACPDTGRKACFRPCPEEAP